MYLHGLGDILDDIGEDDSSSDFISSTDNSSGVTADDLSFAGDYLNSSVDASTVSMSDLDFAGDYLNSSVSASVATVSSAAASGAAIPAQQVSALQAAGQDITNIAGAAGAVYKLVKQPNGSYIAQPGNAAAQAAIAKAQSTRNMLLYGGIGILALVFLKGRK